MPAPQSSTHDESQQTLEIDDLLNAVILATVDLGDGVLGEAA